MRLLKTKGSHIADVELAGSRIHHLTLIKSKKELHVSDCRSRGEYYRYWECACVCGEIIWVRHKFLFRTKNTQKSCGCKRLDSVDNQNLAGTHKGSVTLVKIEARHYPHSKTGKPIKDWYWECLCDCGNMCWLRHDLLFNEKLRGVHKSCGCTKKPENVEARALIHVYKEYQTNAANRGLPFELSFDAALALFKQNCNWCGWPPSNKASRAFKKYNIRYSGIDRVDNSLGYTASNSVSCCAPCNLAKRDYTKDEFLAHNRRIYEHQKALSTPLNPYDKLVKDSPV